MSSPVQHLGSRPPGSNGELSANNLVARAAPDFEDIELAIRSDVALD
jgi:hypothetical protein